MPFPSNCCRTWQQSWQKFLRLVDVDDLYMIKTPGTVSAFLCSNCPASVCEFSADIRLVWMFASRSFSHIGAEGHTIASSPAYFFPRYLPFFAALHLPHWMISHGEWRNMHCEEISACDRDSRGKECGILVWNVGCFRGTQRHNTLQTLSSGCHVYAVCVCLKLPNMVRGPLKLLTSIGECLIAHFKSKNSGATHPESHLQQNVQPFCTCSRYGKI